MKKTTLTALVMGISLMVSSSVSAQNVAQYDHLSALDAHEQSYFVDDIFFLGAGNFKSAFVVPDAGLVIKTCNTRGNTPTSCLFEMQGQIQDYNVLVRDFRDRLVEFYPTNTTRINPFVCADVDPTVPQKDCHFMLEEFLYGSWKRLGVDFVSLENDDTCQWRHLTDEATFVHELNQEMEPLFNAGGYKELISSVNGNSIASLSTTLARVSYAFDDLQGSFTSNGFIISDTGVAEGEDDDRDCQVNWLCALAKKLDTDAECSFVQQED